MTPSAIPGFLTKTEVAELYGRSHRSLTRDFSSAVRVKNVEVLKHLKILTDDEKIREGTDVTLDQIQDLSNRGLSPTWYIERAWAAKRYGLQPEPHVPEPRAKTADVPPLIPRSFCPTRADSSAVLKNRSRHFAMTRKNSTANSQSKTNRFERPTIAHESRMFS